jgi:hypothetical protein
MSNTLKIINGSIVLDPSTGQLETVTGNRKCAQDMAEVFLQEYLPEQDYGSYLAAVASNKIPYATELLVHHYVADAVNRLSAKQMEDPAITDDEQIKDITTLLTSSDSEGGIAFLVGVETQQVGQTAETAVAITALGQQLQEV